MARGYRLGAVDYIQAPVVPEVLRSKVCVFVELYQKTAQVRRQSETMRRRATQLQKLAAASLSINSAVAIEQMMQNLADSAGDIIGCDQALALLFPIRPPPAGGAQRNLFSRALRQMARTRNQPRAAQFNRHRPKPHRHANERRRASRSPGLGHHPLPQTPGDSQRPARRSTHRPLGKKSRPGRDVRLRSREIHRRTTRRSSCNSCRSPPSPSRTRSSPGIGRRTA